MGAHQRVFPEPHDLGFRPDPGRPVVRAVLAAVLPMNQRSTVEAIARREWKNDRAALELIARAATTSATTSGANWASPLAATAVADFVAALGPASAGSQLIAL